MQRVGHLVEAGLRRVALLGQRVGAVKGLLRQHESGLRALHLRLPRGDDLRPRSDQYVGKLGVRNRLCRPHLFVLGHGFGIVDPYEHGPRRNVLAALDGYFLDPSVDARGDVKPRCIGLALHQQRCRSQQIEDGKRGDGSRNDADDDGRNTRRVRVYLPSFTRCVGPGLNFRVGDRGVHA